MLGKKLLLFAVAAIFALSFTACGGPDSGGGVVRIATMDATDDGVPVLTDNARIAQSRGYLEEELAKAGYTVEYVNCGMGNALLGAALSGGSVDVLMSDQMSQLLLRGAGTDIAAIAAVNTRVHNGVVVRSDSGIQSVAELAGKRIILPGASMQEIYFDRLAAEAGVDLSGAETIDTVTEIMSIFLSGQADAVVYGLFSAYYFENMGMGRTIATTLEKDPSWTGQSFVTAKREYWSKRPEVAHAIIRALDRAARWAKETAKTDADAVFAAMSKDERAAAVNARIYAGDLSFDCFRPEIGEASVARLAETMDYMLEHGMLAQTVDLAAFVDPSYLEAALGA